MKSFSEQETNIPLGGKTNLSEIIQTIDYDLKV